MHGNEGRFFAADTANTPMDRRKVNAAAQRCKSAFSHLMTRFSGPKVSQLT